MPRPSVGSRENLAFSVARFTLASSTPSTLPSTFSTRRTHEAHVMPVTGISTSPRLRSSNTAPSSPHVLYPPTLYRDTWIVKDRSRCPAPGAPDAAENVAVIIARCKPLDGLRLR